MVEEEIGRQGGSPKEVGLDEVDGLGVATMVSLLLSSAVNGTSSSHRHIVGTDPQNLQYLEEEIATLG